MANFNRIILAGNLTRDPQLSHLPSNTPVVEFGLAVNRRWRSQEGEMREETCFIDCRSYGRQAETINQHVTKGRPLLVEGRLQFQQWTAQDGSKRSKHIVVVDTFQFIDSRRGGDDYSGGSGSGSGGGARQATSQRDDHAGAPPTPSDSDIPF